MVDSSVTSFLPTQAMLRILEPGILVNISESSQAGDQLPETKGSHSVTHRHPVQIVLHILIPGKWANISETTQPGDQLPETVGYLSLWYSYRCNS